MSQMTIKDIAQLAGVSPITVSRVINNKPDVAERTSLRVQAVIDEHQWRPNAQARGLVRGRTYTLGFISAGITTSFITYVLDAIEQVTTAHNYALMVVSAGDVDRNADHALNMLLKRGVDGIILGGPLQLSQQALQTVQQRDVPLVTLYYPQDSVPLLTTDYKEAGRLAAQHLYDLGHRHCLYVHDSNPLERDFYTAARWEGFSSFRPDTFHTEPLRQSYGGTEALTARLRQGDITGIFCQNDQCLPDVYRSAWELGLDVPHALSVVGCNDQAITRSLTPRVTSVDNAKVQIGEAAALALIKTPSGSRPRGNVYKPELVRRESTAPVRSNQRNTP